jgi:glycine dehydrogenase
MTSLFDYSSEFRSRHNGPNFSDVKVMLKAIGMESIDELIEKTIPKSIRLNKKLDLAKAKSEKQFLENFERMMSKNLVNKSYIGMGYYNVITPSVILRNLLENPGWYTQYTPYQSEISQGRLESLLNFQTVVCDLTGMKIANASLLDEATAAAEAMLMLYNSRSKSKKDAHTLFVDSNLYPQTIDVLKTRAEYLGITLKFGNILTDDCDESVYAAAIQYTSNDGSVSDFKKKIDELKSKDLFILVAADLMSLLLLEAPGNWGADVVVGTSQRFGVPMGFGGPHAAYFATKDDFKRNIPGRIIGVSIDAKGNKAYRMALQTREQHIRREKASSNICTAQALLANIAAMYAVFHGPKGLKKIARRIHVLTIAVDNGLKSLGVEQENKSYFDTLKILASAENQKKIKSIAEAKNINFRYEENFIGISIDETTSIDDIKQIIAVFEEYKSKKTDLKIDENASSILDIFSRKSDYLTHEVFNKYHSETEMMRYLKRLENKDLSLVHSMISLGSCTMKLNAASEMIPVTWKTISSMHPFAPANQTVGYLEMINELENMLKEITGFDAMSLQPNSGAQGEYAGLLVIKKYLESKNEGHRDVCIIPSSAHGTNPASAVMAGMKVVVTKCEENGNIDLNDLQEKLNKHEGNIAALMVTYPSTHGVFEESIQEICEMIHKAGGQVYMDGANMNAQVGLTSPAIIGADVCHLNLHKTFSIPHGGGGPGMGPIGVAKHLAAFLPSHKVISCNSNENASTAVSAAPWGSGSILPISYAYIAMMGADGLTEATEYAILNANYIKKRLSEHYSVLYTGRNDTVAHELIFDVRDLKKDSSVEVEDIAKRLMDYGFHAPTVSFPVAGTMMIEPTESESLAEIDRFCDALISIRNEIREIENGSSDKVDNVLQNAPHTFKELISDDWKHAYSREKAAFPLAWVKENKFWPSVSRVNNVHGDRELICTCPNISEYES